MEVNVTVLMPVYNAELYLTEAIESILSQTYKNFRFLIINDGSTDESENIIKNFSDDRIIYIKNETNIRLVATLNKGIELIQTTYLVRMDADDVSKPERIHELVNFMDNNPDVGVCGSAMEIFGSENSLQQFPENDVQIKTNMLFESCIPHPASIIRMEVLKKNNVCYDERFIHMEDYYLWYRLKNITKFHNLKTVLYKYRISGSNITLVNKNTYSHRLRDFMIFQFNDQGIYPSSSEIDDHLAFTVQAFLSPQSSTESLYRWKTKLLELKEKAGRDDPQLYENQVKLRWQRIFYKLVDRKKSACFSYWRLSGGIKFNQLRYLFGQFLRR